MSNEFWIGLLVQLVVYGVSIGVIYGVMRTRLDYIEKKLDKHNNVAERVYKLEADSKVVFEKISVENNRIKDLEGWQKHEQEKSKKEFKKKVVMWTGVLFVCACLVALVFAWNEKPTDVFTYIIPTAGGVFAAAVVWYLKAVQLENGIKIQLGMIKKLIDLGEENQAEETKERIIQKMKDKTDTIIDEALEPTEIQNF